MRINTNTAAMNTYSNLTSANASKSNSLAKLSSGLRINKAGDDAAGLAISEKMKNQVSGMTQASRNAQDGISLIQTAEGALSETHSILNRMRDLTVQAANGTNTDDDKAAIQAELTSLTAEVDRIAGDTEFNTKGLLNASTVTDSSLKGDVKTGMDKAYEDIIKEAPTNIEDYNKLDSVQIKNVVNKYNENNNIALTGVLTTDTADKAAVKINTEDLAASYNKLYGSSVEGGTDVAKTDVLATVNALIEDAEAGTPTATTGASKLKIKNLQKEFDSSNNITANDISETHSQEFSFQIGANAGEKISIEMENMSAKGLGLSDINVVNGDTDDILGKLDKAISSVSSQRANLGAVQNRLDHTVSNLATTKENLSEANSRITDVDMAEEMMSFTKSNILSQASTSMLAQANQMPQSVLSLLQ